MNEHFNDPVSEAHAKKTDEIIALYEHGQLTVEQAGEEMSKHVWGND